MKKIILAFDSFKGTLTAKQVCDIVAEAAARRFPGAEIVRLPLSDGGEGLVNAYLNILGGSEQRARVSGPLGAPVEAIYGLLPDGSAVMETACCAGLPLLGETRAPLDATTRGVGELILHAAGQGVKRVLLGLGGSATNDCGLGLAAALGYVFLDAAEQPLPPLARHLARIERIVPPPELPPVAVVALCDVDNPLCGENGAVYTFGAQKGVTEDLRPELDAAFRHLAEVIRRDLGADILRLPGAGAAGGLGGGVVAFLHGKLRPGIEALLDAAGFDALLNGADLVLTGEGRIDWQTARGKAPAGVARRAQRQGVPCVALCGAIGAQAEQVYETGIAAFFSAVRGTADWASVQRTCAEDLRQLADNVLRLWQTAR